MRTQLRAALATLDTATLHARGAAFALLHLAERLAVVGVALTFVDGGGPRAIAAVIGVAAIVALRALARGGYRAAVQVALHRRVVVLLLHGDLLRAAPLDDDDAEAAILDGVETVERLLTDAAPSLVADVAASAALAALLAAVLPPRVLVVGAAALACAAAGLLVVRRVTFREVDRAWRAYRPVVDRLVGAIGGRLEIVANGARRAYVARADAELAAWGRAAVRAERLTAVSARLPALIAASAVGVALLADSALRGAVTLRAFGDAAVFVAALPAFAGVVRSATELFKATAAMAPLAPLLAVAAPIAALAAAPRAAAPGEAPAAAPGEAPAEVRLAGVGFRYDGATSPALHGVDLAWRRGEVLVLAGANGSGKSTLLRLALGVAPAYDGSIAVDDGGEPRELRGLDGDAWRARIAYLPQRPYVLDRATVGEALRALDEGADDGALRRALDRVRLWSALAEKRPDAPLGVRVGALSVGERQRLAVARLVIRDRPVVVLDEPDANLDAAGIREIAALVRELAEGRMVLVAAHTPELVAAGDVVATLDRGAIVDVARRPVAVHVRAAP